MKSKLQVSRAVDSTKLGLFAAAMIILMAEHTSAATSTRRDAPGSHAATANAISDALYETGDNIAKNNTGGVVQAMDPNILASMCSGFLKLTPENFATLLNDVRYDPRIKDLCDKMRVKEPYRSDLCVRDEKPLSKKPYRLDEHEKEFHGNPLVCVKFVLALFAPDASSETTHDCQDVLFNFHRLAHYLTFNGLHIVHGGHRVSYKTDKTYGLWDAILDFLWDSECRGGEDDQIYDDGWYDRLDVVYKQWLKYSQTPRRERVGNGFLQFINAVNDYR